MRLLGCVCKGLLRFTQGVTGSHICWAGRHCWISQRKVNVRLYIKNWSQPVQYCSLRKVICKRWGMNHHTQFDEPLRNDPGWWDDRTRNLKCVLPLYLRLDMSSNHLCRALSCLRLSCHNFWSKECVQTGTEGLRSSGSATPNVTGKLFRMRNTLCWCRMNILSIWLQIST